MDKELAQAISVLPRRLREAASGLGDAEELHLRTGRPFTWAGPDGRETALLPGGRRVLVTGEEIRMTLELATRASCHTAMGKLCAGYLPLQGGHRLGVVGTAELRDGRIHAFRSVSALCLRIAHPVQNMADHLAAALFAREPAASALLFSPPGGGKTTLLRELLRLASDRYGIRPSLADERGEVAALWEGEAQFDVGEHTDVLDGCPKAQGLLLLLRSMSPQLLAADEITAPEDVAALSQAANCGVPVLASAHAECWTELTRRPLYRRLLEERIFTHVVQISRKEGRRHYELLELAEQPSGQHMRPGGQRLGLCTAASRGTSASAPAARSGLGSGGHGAGAPMVCLSHGEAAEDGLQQHGWRNTGSDVCIIPSKPGVQVNFRAMD